MKNMMLKWQAVMDTRLRRAVKYMRRRDGQGMVDYVLVICIVAALAIAAIGPLRNAVLAGIGHVVRIIKEIFE